ncbi:1-deoxy-D-xylulose-5-phosphate synthase family protein [Mycobacterium xenopi 4042]|uniref:1-deoxy-D-xylulose-5-phosphate synthase family protein n=1 Tax=Mycobacterium xenopi 4042 TaxID=1299334 RepID=X8DLD6_MYCXE|nr:1-deoxy-D-xylulose-5-phosphate synthase family protein [Mycobacterium xenopi 4042]
MLGGAQQHRRPARHPIVIVINDNGRSYDPTTGALAEHLAHLRMRPTTSGTSR